MVQNISVCILLVTKTLISHEQKHDQFSSRQLCISFKVAAFYTTFHVIKDRVGYSRKENFSYVSVSNWKSHQ